MQARREQLQRGTPDLPFERYSFHYSAPRRTVVNTHWHPEQEILYVKKGAIEVLIGKHTIILGENEICFVAPNALHSVITSLADTDYYALVFSYDLLTLPDSHFFQNAITEPMQKGRLTFPTTMDDSDPHFPIVKAYLENMCTYSRSAPDYKLQIFRWLICLYAALQDTLITADGTESTADNQAVKACLDHMHAHYAQKITLDDLAALVHLHPNYLCHLFKIYTGQTAFQQLTRIRLDNAASLLDQGCTVSQAAQQSGFESASFFSRKFKQIMGYPPKAYSSRTQKKVY